jgi:hypothetical protein
MPYAAWSHWRQGAPPLVTVKLGRIHLPWLAKGVANATICPPGKVHVVVSALSFPNWLLGGRQPAAAAMVDFQQLLLAAQVQNAPSPEPASSGDCAAEDGVPHAAATNTIAHAQAFDADDKPTADRTSLAGCG